MGNRREPRTEKNLPVRIFGTDADGRIFSEKVTTVNVSQRGAEVSGVKATVRLDEVVGLSHNQNKGHFKIKWIGQPHTPKAGHLGLVNVSPEKPFWDFAVPAPATDSFQPAVVERRKYPRVRCATSVELHPEGAAMIWGKASDLSIGGCYIEMAIPLPPGTKLKLGIWIGEKKCWAAGKVTNSTPGFGFGIQFTEIAGKDMQLLSDFVNTVKQE
jgi:PilZ domain